MTQRTICLEKYKHSLFLLGPRQTGKTYLIKNTLSPVIFIDLLKHSEFMRYARDVSLLSGEVRALNIEEGLIVIDEIQRLPGLLDEVQLLMEEKPKMKFILTGSSARKLKRSGANLLGGRAITIHLYPFTHMELGDGFILEDALLFGTLPKIALEKKGEDKIRLLKSYIETYLNEEVTQEALIRNIPAFARFQELAAYENGNLINYQSLAREVGVHSKTIKEYFQILEDTLLGFFIYPYGRSSRTKIVSHPKFYFFDCGIVACLKNVIYSGLVAGTPPYGRAFEHFIMVETKRILDYSEAASKMSFFRTSDGAEIDMILEFRDEIWAVEIKASGEPRLSDVRGLRSFISDHGHTRAICVCFTPRPYKYEKIEFLPWRDFMGQLPRPL
ncbi:MAG: ATP-binding protein [Candidatus Omnitrophica bacterium]|nr:ATP-binding protein [Candidatus Omnitrophota bacterium]